MRLTIPAVLLLALTLPTITAPAQVAHYLDLKVLNGTNQPRVNEPVSFGVPISKGNNLHYLEWFQIVDSNDQDVPHQFKVLTRWGGDRNDVSKPIRWVLVTLNANVPANGTSTYHVALGAPPAHGDLYASNQMHFIEVHTAPNTYFRIYKWQFRLFDTAVVNGTPLVSPGRLDMVTSTGTNVTPVITETVLEEYQGWQSVRCVVRQRGQLGQLRFTCRWYFYSGRSDVTVDFRLENPNAYGLFSTTLPDGQVYFGSLYLVQPVLGGGAYSLTTDTTVRSLTTSQSYDVQQHFDPALAGPTDLWSGFKFNELVNGVQVATGNRFKGAVDLKGSAGGVTVTVDRFWQNFPKSFRAQSGELQVGLFPEWGNGPEYKGQYDTPTNASPVDPMALSNYRFEGGRWKSSRMVFDFHTGAKTTAAVNLESDRVNAPLVGTAPPAWIRLSFATGTLWSERRPTSDVGEQRWERFTDILVNDAATDTTNVGQLGYPLFIRRGGTYGGHQTYGWDHFGDIPWGDGYCSQHYDWTRAFISGFWRTGDYRLFDTGRDVAAGRRDYNQNHSTNPAESWRGASFYEKGYWQGNYSSGFMSHNWLDGLLMYYVTTGDEATREAAIENVNFVLANAPKNWDGWWGSRIPGWSIDNLVSAYAYLGDQVYLTEAGLGVHRFEQLELAGGGLGCVLNPANGMTQGWMENIAQIGAGKYYLNSGDQTVLPLLGRMRDWDKNAICVLPTGTYPNLTLTMCHEYWAPGAPGNLSVHHCWAMSEALAYIAVAFHSSNDLLWSKTFFDGPSRYWQAGGGPATFDCTNTATFSPVTFRPSMYPGSESKVVGNLLLWGGGHAAAALLVP